MHHREFRKIINIAIFGMFIKYSIKERFVKNKFYKFWEYIQYGWKVHNIGRKTDSSAEAKQKKDL